jgi:hypothetical protein
MFCSFIKQHLLFTPLQMVEFIEKNAQKTGLAPGRTPAWRPVWTGLRPGKTPAWNPVVTGLMTGS